MKGMIERSPEAENEFRKVKDAVTQTIYHILNSPEVIANLSDTQRAKFMEIRSILGNPGLDRRGLEKLVIATIALLDMFLVEEMSAKRQDDFRRFYAREFGYGNDLALKAGELNHVVEQICLKENLIKLPVASLLSGEAYSGKKVFIEKPVDAESEGAFVRRLTRLNLKYGTVYYVVRAGEVALLKKAYFDYDGSFKNGSTTGMIPTASSVSRQDLWLNLLRSGVPLFGPESNEKQSGSEKSNVRPEDIIKDLDKLVPESSVDKWRKTYRRKLNVFLGSAGNSDKMAKFLEGHTRHYERFFERGGVRPKTILTRSGVSANETAIKTVLELCGGQAKAYVHPGWYYENRKTIRDNFSLSQDLGQSNVLFLNATPSIPESYCQLEGQAGNFETDRNVLIRQFIVMAEKNPDKQYFMVVDKTSNLLFESFADPKSLPKNLHVFETFSLTKHQRGAKNYFYGGLNYWGDKKNEELIDEKAKTEHTSLSEFGIINLPRLGRVEYSRSLEKMKACNASLARGVNETMQVLPPDLRWPVEAHEYFVYVSLPVRGLTEFASSAPRRILESNSLMSYSHNEFKMADNFPLNTFSLDQRMKDERNEFLRTIGINFADSFGLSDTRLCTVNQMMTDVIKRKGSGAQKVFYSYFLRVAAGSSEDEQSAYEKGRKLGEYIVSLMPRVSEEELKLMRPQVKPKQQLKQQKKSGGWKQPGVEV